MNIIDYLSQGLFVVPLFALIINNFFPKRFARRVFCITAGTVAAIEMIDSVILLLFLEKSNFDSFNFNISLLEGSAGHCFRISQLQLFLMFCIGLVCFVSVMIARKTIRFKKRSYVTLLMCLVLGMNGMLLSTDLFSLYVFLEIVGISSFVLIAMFRSRSGLEGSFKYLVISAIGVMMMLVGLSFIFMQTGSLDYNDLGTNLIKGADYSHKALSYAAVIFIIGGFSVKAGAVPFHSWLPDAHQSADTAVSVLLSGIVIKIAGIYGLVVTMKLFGEIFAVQLTYQIIGIISIVYGALLATRQTHFKRICAYSSVSQMGYIILAVSSNTEFGIVAAMAHVFSHAVFKSTLFTNAAALHEQTGTLDIKEMGGLEKSMPVTAFSSVIAFFSTAGIPPCCGFWSKLLIILSLWRSNNQVWACAALVSSIFTSVYFLRLQKHVFFGKPIENKQVKEIRGTVKTVEIILTVITIGVGLAYPFILKLLSAYGFLT